MKFDYTALMFWFNIFQFLFTAAVAWYVRRVAKQKTTETRFRKIEANITQFATAKDLDELQAVTAQNLTAVQDKISAGCQAHQMRTSKVEATAAALRIELEHLPTQQQFEALNGSITALNGELKNTQGRLEGINRAVDLINEFLINQGGAKGKGA